MQIEVSFQTWQRLTALLENERDNFDRVILRLIADRRGTEQKPGMASAAAPELAIKGVSLPNGTLLRATFKGKTHYSEIIEGRWFDRAGGKQRTSPSQAARAITGIATNGWLFWEAKRPGEDAWHRLATLRGAS